MKLVKTLPAIQLCAITAVCMHAFAAPGKLSDKPLFLGSAVEPNILFLIDDSGSMDHEVLLSNGALRAHPRARNKGDLDFTPSSAARARELCSGYNVMAYNPNINYSPWSGNDARGSAFGNQSISSALTKPFISSNTANLSSHFYIEWNDDGDKLYESGECQTAGATSSATRNASSCPGCVFVATLSPQEQANYANWFSFYRKREFVAKKAISAIVTGGGARMGLASLHNNGGDGAEVKSFDDTSSGVAHKNLLLNSLFKIEPDDKTPLRATLDRAGQYFQVGVDPGSKLFGFEPTEKSPILSEAEGGACQQNFSILMSDGFWNEGFSRLGNNDGDNNSNFDGGSFADDYKNTLADVAMHYYETDLAPLLPNEVPVNASDENSQQHMVTYTVAFGVNGSLQSNPTNITQPFAWPEPVSGTQSTIDDMRHAAWNGRGEFLSAQDPQQLISSLTAAIDDIQSRVGSASAATFNTSSITQETLVFQASFNSGDWSGELSAFQFDNNGVGNLVWQASDLLNNPSLNINNRAIYTFNEVSQKGVPFAFPSNYKSYLDDASLVDSLSPAQIRDLLATAPFADSTTDTTEIQANQQHAEELVAYLKGSFQFEGSKFRNRGGKRLGDIIHSGPTFVGKPKELYPSSIEAVSYFDFVAANENRTPAVYVGANDGMLHAFHAQTGAELFAYIPSALFSSNPNQGLHHLAELNYDHLGYVDASPVVRDVFVGGLWKTYLVGGLRTGGKAVYALDITNPNSYSNASTPAAEKLAALEFTHPDLGFTFGKPQIAKMNNNKWAAIFGNGYNNDPSGDGQAKLFIVYLDGSGFDVLETRTGSLVNGDCNDSQSDCNGLSSPSLIDTNSDFVVDRIYAGDLHGNMWAFDVSASTTTNWSSAFGSNSLPSPLFTACSLALASGVCPLGGRQPITTKPLAQAHPTVNALSTEPNVLVLFGTGQYLTPQDVKNTSLQSFYGIWDAGGSNGSLDRGDLVSQQIIVPSLSIPFKVRQLTQNAVPYNPGPISRIMGWFIDLQESNNLIGERVSINPIIAGDLVFFSTTIPEADVCSVGGGSFLMAADLATGGQPDRQVFSAINLGSVVQSFDSSLDNFSGVQLDAGAGGTTLINNDTVAIPDALGRINSVKFNPLASSKNSRRSSWSILK